MSQRHELELPDEQLLAEVERALAGEPGAGEPGSLGHLATLLASAAPQARPEFQATLERQLSWRLEAARAEPEGRARRQVEPVAQHQPRTPWALLRRLLFVQATPRSTRKPWALLRRVALAQAVLLIAFTIPGVRDTTSEVLSGIFSYGSSMPDGTKLFSPAPPFIVKQPAYLPGDMRNVAVRHSTGPSSGAVAPSATAGPAAMPLVPGPLWHELGQPRGAEAFIAIGYEGSDGQWLVLFERARRSGEQLPAGERLKVGSDPGVLQVGQGQLRLVWISSWTWIELVGSLPRAELLRVAESLRETQRPSAEELSQGGPGVESTFFEIKLGTLEEAQQIVPFPLPEPAWIPPGFRYKGTHATHAMAAWVNHVYERPHPDQAKSATISVTIVWGHDDTTSTYFGDIEVTEETVQVRGVPARLRTIVNHDGRDYVLNWEADGFSYALMLNGADLSRADMLRMAESIQTK